MNIKKYIYKFLILFFLIFYSISSYAAEDHAREEENVKGNSAFTIDEYGNTEFLGDVKIGRKLTVNDEAWVSVPIGTVIDWWRPDDSFSVPKNFAICDGAYIYDSESPYENRNLPNLMGKFIRGTNLNDIGNEGGRDRQPINIRTTDDGLHRHNFHSNGQRTKLISNGGDNPGRGDYMIQDEDRWTSKEHIWVEQGYWSERSGNHRHDLPDTDFSGSHNHGVHFEVDTIPEYVGLLKIMRIK